MARRKDDLYLQEEVMLLALRDETGTPESRAGMVCIAVGAAIFSELVLAGAIEVEEGKKKLVNLVKSTTFHDPLLDECLELIASAKRRRSATSWVTRFGNLRRVRHRVAEGLCRRGILRDSEDRVLLFFKRRAFPTIDPVPESRLLERLRQAILSDDEQLEPRTAVLVGLAHATSMLRVHFDKATLKQRKKRLERIAEGELVAKAAGEAVQAAQAAAMAAIIAATAVTTISAASH